MDNWYMTPYDNSNSNFSPILIQASKSQIKLIKDMENKATNNPTYTPNDTTSQQFLTTPTLNTPKQYYQNYKSIQPQLTLTPQPPQVNNNTSPWDSYYSTNWASNSANPWQTKYSTVYNSGEIPNDSLNNSGEISNNSLNKSGEILNKSGTTTTLAPPGTLTKHYHWTKQNYNTTGTVELTNQYTTMVPVMMVPVTTISM